MTIFSFKNQHKNLSGGFFSSKLYMYTGGTWLKGFMGLFVQTE